MNLDKWLPKDKEQCSSLDCMPYEFCGCNVDTHNKALTDCKQALSKLKVDREGLKEIIQKSSIKMSAGECINLYNTISDYIESEGFKEESGKGLKG